MKGVIPSPIPEEKVDTLDASITIKRDTDRNLPYAIEITGYWTVPQIQGIFGALVKANRGHIAKMKANPTEGA